MKGQLRTIHGLVSSEWSTANGTFTLAATIPANTTATIHVPAKDAEGVMESGKPAATAEGVKFLRTENGTAVYAVESGSYLFTSRPGPAASGVDPAPSGK